MKLMFFFILLFVGANCSCLSINVFKEILTQLKKSTSEIQNSVAKNTDHINDLHNQSSSCSMMFEINLDKMQKHLMEKTEQIIDQKFTSISKDLQKTALNTDKFLTSIDQVSASVALNMKYINDLHNQNSSNSMIFMMFESKFDEILTKLERTEQIIDRKFASISEDHRNSTLNTEKLQDSVDHLSVEHNETSSTVDQLSPSMAEIKKYIKEEHKEISSFITTLENKLNDSQETVKILDQKIASISEDYAILKLQQAVQNLSDCKDLFNSGKNVSTSHSLPKYNREVLCDMTTDGEEWLVIQQRKKVTKQVNFTRNWASYKEGFGDLDTEFWIGNECLHRITNQKSYELRIDMEDFENRTFYATYSEFRVENEDSQYKLHVGGFEGNVRDSLTIHNNMKFSTFDRDNDDSYYANCVEKYSGGFWFKVCGTAFLNGLYPTVPNRKNEKLIRWYHKREFLILTNVEMKIRPKQ